MSDDDEANEGREAPGERRSGAPPALLRDPRVLTSAASGLFLLTGWLAGHFSAPGFAVWGLYLASFALGAYFFGKEALEELFTEAEVGIELLMLVAAIAAILMREPMEGAMLAFLYSISEAAEGFTESKTRSAIRALMDLTPKTATVLRDGREEEVPVESLVPGDVFLLRPGQSVPTDGVVRRGRSSLNQAPITGESIPVEKSERDSVFAGSINGEGALEVEATMAFANNTVQRIIGMVEEAQERKGQSQRFIERFGKRYSPAVLLAGILIAILPPLLFSAQWLSWLHRATVFIVAAAPCALVISIPITLVATLGTAARKGVLIKGGAFVEQLARVEVVALDKTGTITRGKPEVTDVVAMNEKIPGDEALLLAAAVDWQSQHPLARAIVEHALGRGRPLMAASDFRSLTGAGAQAVIDERTVYVGSAELFTGRLKLDLAHLEQELDRLRSEGKTVVVVGTDKEALALIALRDNPRPNARTAIAELRAAGVRRIVMLTGDNARTAAALAQEVGVDEVHAALKPEDKALKVRELTQREGHVAMVGDGVNDAPALAEATVGVAMGAMGTDVALETADVALMADDLQRLAYALGLAKRNRQVVRQNLVLSAVVIGVLVAGALAGVFTLPIAVLAHEISEFIVIGSGLRMLKA